MRENLLFYSLTILQAGHPLLLVEMHLMFVMYAVKSFF